MSIHRPRRQRAAGILRSAASVLCVLVCQTLWGQQPIPLWPATPPGDSNLQLEEERDTSGADAGKVAGRPVIRLANVSQPTLEVFPPAAGTGNGTAVVICPGGGHRILAYDLEGTEVARWLQARGITAFVLKYRVPARPERPRWEAAVQDAQRAMSLVRASAEKWSIDPKRIGILGFSAGGQTAALAAVREDRLYESVDEADLVSMRPDFAILIYPAYLVDPSDQTRLAQEVTVTDKSPPMFLVHTWDDPVTPQSSLLLAAELRRVGVPAELHLFDRGGHGYGMRATDLAVTGWPRLCERWLQEGNLLQSPGSSITALLERQQAAWNRGDIEAFMSDYWQSDDLTFSSGGKITRGFQGTLDRYRQRYPTAERMGKTTFSDLEIRILDDTNALVLGRWSLERGEEKMEGNFSLVLRQIEGQWKIIHDHTSLLAAE